MNAGNAASLGQQLESALLAPLKPEVANLGARLLARLDRPVHIAIIGPPDAGKTRLGELLAQQSDLSECLLFELSTTSDDADLCTAAGRADIALWCGQTFGAADLALWSKMPDRLKDHSFLVLTKADSLAAQGQLQSTLALLRDIAAEEFLQVFPVAALQGLAASGPNATNAGAALRASGAEALKQAILRQIAQARGAVRDSVLVFLDRYGATEWAVAAAQSEPVAPANPVVPQISELWAPSHDYLAARARDLASAQALPATEKARPVMQHCCETIDGLVGLLPVQSALIGAQATLAQEILAVADTMVLLQLEGGARSAIDGMALLLQLRRDIAVCSLS